MGEKEEEREGKERDFGVGVCPLWKGGVRECYWWRIDERF